jgi:sporulation protein YlmC with PRC-barrel domain
MRGPRIQRLALVLCWLSHKSGSKSDRGVAPRRIWTRVSQKKQDYLLISVEALTSINSVPSRHAGGNWSERLAMGGVPRGDQQEPPMRKIIAISIAATMLSTGVIAQTTPSDPTRTQTPSEAKPLTSLPSPSVSISEIYNQSVYDSANNKIGEVQDILLSPDGRATALIIGVGGFLGIGEKDVAVSFNALKRTTKDNKAYLTLDASKNALKSAPGFKYDRQKSAWVPETQSK